MARRRGGSGSDEEARVMSYRRDRTATALASGPAGTGSRGARDPDPTGNGWMSALTAPLACAGLALLIRAAYLIESADNPFRSFIGLDMTGYHRWAVSVLKGQGLGEMPFTQAPFYPLALAVTYLFTGQDWVRGVWGNLLPSAAAVFFAADAARRWRGPAAAWGAGLLLALSKPAVFYTGVLLPPSWVLLLASLCLWLCVRVVRSEGPPGTGLLAGAGLAAGLLSLAQPAAIGGLLPLVVYLWRRDRQDGGIRSGRRLLTCLPAAAILPLATLLYNGVGGNAWSPIAVNAGINLYIGNGPEANGGYVRPPAMREDRDLLGIGAARTLAGNAGLNAAEANRFWTDRASSHALAHPVRTAGLFLRKLHLFFGQYEVPQVESLPFERRYARLLRLPLPGMAFLAAAGLFGLLVRRRDGLAQGLGWTVLASAVAVCAFFVTARFRVPVVPVLAVLGGAGIAEWVDLSRSRPVASSEGGPDVGEVRGAGGRLRSGHVAARRETGAAPRPSGFALAWSALASALFAVLLVLNLSGIQRRASDGQSYFRLGIVLERQNKTAEAMQAYRQALEIDPTQGKAEVNLGRLLARAGRLDEARVHFQRGVRLDPLSVIGFSNLGQLEQLQGRREEALAAYRQALAIDPGHLDTQRFAKRLLLEMGRPEEAKRVGPDLEVPNSPPPPSFAEP